MREEKDFLRAIFILSMNDTAPLSRQLNRTLIASVLFIDIVDYTARPEPDQLEMKELFNTMLAEAVHDVAPSERIMVDTGSGASISFLGGPEDALFAALSLRAAIDATMIISGEPGFMRMGISFGSIKIVRDMNGLMDMVGEGVNDALRVMHMAKPGQMMVSDTYFDVISRHSPDYARLFDDGGTHAVHQFRPVRDNENLTEKLRDRRLMPDDAPLPAIPAVSPNAWAPMSKVENERRLPGLIAAVVGTAILANIIWSWNSKPEPWRPPTEAMLPARSLTDTPLRTRVEAAKAADIRADVKLAAGGLHALPKKEQPIQHPGETGKKSEKMAEPDKQAP